MKGVEVRSSGILETSPPSPVTGLSVEEKYTFFNSLIELNNQGLLDPQISLPEFYTLFQLYPLDTIIDGYFFLKKEQLKGEGNFVNFFADIAKIGLKYGDDDNCLFHFDANKINQETGRPIVEQVVDNLLAAVAEYPLAESVAEEERSQRWDTSDWRLRCGSGYIDEILQTAYLSGQKLGFERDRYLANIENYYRLRAGRMRGDTRVFIEFSPSPIITPQAVKRGYRGLDCVFFFTYNPDSKEEVVSQRWLQGGWIAFVVLLRELGRDVKDKASDVDIMNKSDFFNQEELFRIEGFINRCRWQLLRNEAAVRDYLQQELRPYLVREALPIVIAGSASVINGIYLEKHGDELFATLAYAQAKLKDKIAQLTAGRVTLELAPPVAFELDNSLEARLELVRGNNLRLDFCGGSITAKNPYGIPSSIDKIFLNRQGWDWSECVHCRQIKMVRCGWCQDCAVEVYGYSEE